MGRRHRVSRTGGAAALKGKLRNRLLGGKPYTIVPKYRSANARLPRAESEGRMTADQESFAIDGTGDQA